MNIGNGVVRRLAGVWLLALIVLAGSFLLLEPLAGQADAVEQSNPLFPTVGCGGEWHWVHNQTEASSGTLTATFANAGVVSVSARWNGTVLHYTLHLNEGDTLLSAADDVADGKLLLSHYPSCATTTSQTSTPTTSPTTSSPTTSPTTSSPTTSPTTSSPTTSPTTSTPATSPPTSNILGEIGDYVWFDRDVDGEQDSNEAGVADVTVNLYLANTSTPIAATATDSSGRYLFTGLPAGVYSVEFNLSSLPQPHVITKQDSAPDHLDSDGDPLTGRTIDISLDAGEIDHTWDLGIYVLNVFESTIVSTVPGDTTVTTTPGGTTTNSTLPFTGIAGEATAGIAALMLGLGVLLLVLLRRESGHVTVQAGFRSTMVWDGDVLRWERPDRN